MAVNLWLLNCGDGFMGTCICSSPLYTLNMCSFFVYKLHLNKAVKKKPPIEILKF